MNSSEQQIHLANYVSFFEHLAVADLDKLERVYTEDAHFKDPFNDVHSRDDIKRIFQHMFATLKQPVFSVEEAMIDNQIAYIKWQFNATFNNDKPLTLTGVSRVRLTEQGLVSEHIDYWDSAEQLYMTLPLIGSVLRFIQKHLRP